MKRELNTRDDIVSLMNEILEPLLPLYTEGKAGIVIGDTSAYYDRKAIYMEAFSRPLWGLVPYWAGGDTEGRFGEIYREGLIHGTDPDHAEYWGKCTPFDQKFVEMAAIAYGLLYAPKVIWDPLTKQQKKNLAEYLNQINDNPLPVCNWIMFAVLVNIALRSVGQPYREDMLERYLNDCETFYLGDGWYQDGDSGQKDYYVSFAIHFYNMIYADRSKQIDPERFKRLQQRACEFAKQFLYWFDEDGAAIPFGRSLTYRFSQVAFFSACVLTGLSPLPLGVMKGLIMRHLDDWLKHPIFDRDHVLTIGYGYANLNMAEGYNAPGSPYWAMKTFAILALPASHKFWQIKAEPYPSCKGLHPLTYADMLIYHYGAHTTAFVPGCYSHYGHGNLPAKYSKFAYDSRFSISVARSCYEIHENAPDNMLAFFIHDYVYVRRECIESKIHEDSVYSKWSPYPGIVVETWIYPTENGHLRKHRIQSNIECEAYDCGFSIEREDDIYQIEQNETSAMAKNEYSSCKISGKTKCNGMIIYPNPNTNLWWNRTVLPAVKYKIAAGISELETLVEITYRS